MMEIDPIDLFNSPLTDYVYAVIDSRSKTEFLNDHIPTSVCAREYETFQDLRSEILDMGYINCHKVVVYGDMTLEYTMSLISFLDSNTREVCVIKGGYEAFKAQFPGIVDGNGKYSDKFIPQYLPKVNLFLGSGMSADVDLLSALGVKAIVNMGAHEAKRADVMNEFNYLFVDIEDCDDQALEPYISQALHFLNEYRDKGPTFVHCSQGVSRSVSLVIALLIRQHGMSYSSAYDYVKGCRKIARPNQGFVAQLKEMR